MARWTSASTKYCGRLFARELVQGVQMKCSQNRLFAYHGQIWHAGSMNAIFFSMSFIRSVYACRSSPGVNFHAACHTIPEGVVTCGYGLVRRASKLASLRGLELREQVLRKKELGRAGAGRGPRGLGVRLGLLRPGPGRGRGAGGYRRPGRGPGRGPARAARDGGANTAPPAAGGGGPAPAAPASGGGDNTAPPRRGHDHDGPRPRTGRRAVHPPRPARRGGLRRPPPPPPPPPRWGAYAATRIRDREGGALPCSATSMTGLSGSGGRRFLHDGVRRPRLPSCSNSHEFSPLPPTLPPPWTRMAYFHRRVFIPGFAMPLPVSRE